VEQQSIDGQLRAPLLTDSNRWRRAICDFPTRVTFQRIDDSFARYGASINAKNKSLVITDDQDKNRKANFTFERPASDQNDSRRQHGRPHRSHATKANRPQPVPARQPRLPLDSGVFVQPLA
jgi:hypothetical protein